MTVNYKAHAEELARAIRELMPILPKCTMRNVAFRAMLRFDQAENDAKLAAIAESQTTIFAVGPESSAIVTHRPYSNPGTSLEAAASLNLDQVRSIRIAVLTWLRAFPSTDGELSIKLHMPEDTVRARRVGLVKEGLVRDSGVTRRTKRGRQAVVWETP